MFSNRDKCCIYLILICWLTPEKLLMISRFQSWYCRVKVTQRQDGAGTYTAHLQLQHLVYTDTGKWRGWGNWRALYFLFPGSYVCSFNDSQDRISPESNTKVYIFVFDEINLLTHSGFDFQQSVAYKSAQIPCRWVLTLRNTLRDICLIIVILLWCSVFSDRLTPTFLSASPCRGRGRLIWIMNSSNLIRRWEKGRYALWRLDIFMFISKTVN